MYIPVNGAASEIPSFSSSSEELIYFKSKVLFVKNVSFAICANNVDNSTVVTAPVDYCHSSSHISE